MRQHTHKKKIIISVSNDLVSDQRVHKVALTLQNNGYNVVLVGRKLRDSMPVFRNYDTKRFRLIFNKGFLFYACLNISLFFYLLFKKSNILLSNDLDTLPANFFVSKLKNIPLVYDSHELFTEVPELNNRKFVKRFWIITERIILPKIKFSYTVCDSLSRIYFEKYGLKMATIRNVPYYTKTNNKKNNSIKKIIYQGALNIDRGLEEIIEAMQYLDNCVLQIVGSGDIENELKKLVTQTNTEKKVLFSGRIPFEKLKKITSQADIGISFEQNTNLNYYYSLPNKIFDYIHAGVPVLASDFPEIKNIINKYKVGTIITDYNPISLSSKIKEIIKNEKQLTEWKINSCKAAKELCWQNEEKKLLKIFDSINLP